MYGKLVIIIVSVVSLTACAVSQDPSQGGFMGGLVGLSSGTYETRVQQRQDELNRQQNVNQVLREQSKALESEARARDFELSLEKERLAKMEGDLSRLESDVNHLAAKSSKQKAEITALKRRLEDQRRQLQSQQTALNELDRAGGSAADPERYRALERERDRLAEEYRLLLEYSQSLSRAAN